WLRLFLAIQHLIQQITQAGRGCWRGLRRFGFIVFHRRVALLLFLVRLVFLLLFLFAAGVQESAATALLLSSAWLTVGAALVLIAENCPQHSGSELAWVLAGGQHVLDLHLRDLLQVRRHQRMLE